MALGWDALSVHIPRFAWESVSRDVEEGEEEPADDRCSIAMGCFGSACLQLYPRDESSMGLGVAIWGKKI
eukprot:104362-Pelagomonas_calceolata.AAC.10